jgi:hypothetical protein
LNGRQLDDGLGHHAADCGAVNPEQSSQVAADRPAANISVISRF